MTTVGYGGFSPRTGLGQMLASVIVICGYGIIAVPTGIVSAEMVRASRRDEEHRICSNFKDRFHAPHAIYCKSCGQKFD